MVKYTTPHFEGMVCLVSPENSWIGQYQRIDKKVKGTYALNVFEKPSPSVLRELKKLNIRYIDRSPAEAV